MSKITIDNDYRAWIGEIKSQIKASQIKASLSVNSELIKLYWYIGEKIWEIQKNSTYGDGIIAQVANDLKNEFPEMTGFSRSNIFAMRQLYMFYFQNNTNVQQLVGLSGQNENVQQPVGFSENIQSKTTIKTNAAQVVQHFNSDEIPALIVSIPWGHHTTILRKIKNLNEAIFYIEKTVENNWSRSVLEYQIETNLYQRQGKAITNFKNVLPAIQSDLANALLKDPYNFEFITLTERAREKDLETKLVQHISKFLLELGKGFAYMGQQFLLKVGSKEYRTDLLFYHTRLKCYVIIELKNKEFEPEFVGKLNFYISAVNELVKDLNDNPTIGILFCKNKDNYEVEFALKDIYKPIGVSEYRYTELPENIRQSMPTIEELTYELNRFEKE